MSAEETFDRWLSSRRKRLNLTQQSIADAIDVTKQTVSNWETGRTKPEIAIEQVKKLCEVLQCQLEDIPEV